MSQQEVFIMAFICPKCKSMMHPPISLCREGHSFCHQCLQFYNTCPLCNKYDGNAVARNFSLEKIHEKVLLPCTYQGNGCTFIGLGSCMLAHEESCLWNRKSCPFSSTSQCQWMGLHNCVMDHCIKEHPTSTFCARSPIIKVGDLLFQPAPDIWHTFFEVIIIDHDELFKCCWEIRYDIGHIKFCVIHLGLRANADKFAYELQLWNIYTEEVSILHGKCQPVDGAGILCSEGPQCLVLLRSTVLKFIYDNDLSFCIAIRRV